jgi:hypothetical protein
MVSKEITSVFIIMGIAFLLLVLASQYTDFSVVRPRLEVKEPFEDAAASPPVTGLLEMSSIAPGPADITNQRKPYHLLNGVLPDADADKPSGLTAERCYSMNFATRFEKTNNYLQRTNNYKRGTPDNCTAPLSDLVDSFYKVEAVT